MTLAEIVSTRIAPAMLERVVFDQGVLDESQRTGLFKASGLSQQEIARKTVEAYGTQAAKLAYGVYEQVYETDWETARLLFEHFKSRPEIEYYNHQASLVGRIPNLPMEELSDFLKAVKRHVCLIVSRNGNNGPVVRGTGFLVAPDLVLTCRHVLNSFPKDADVVANGSRIELYFDFYYGDPVEGVGVDLPRARKVRLHKNWHVESRDATAPDGLEGALSDADVARISGALDFVLLRLDESIGLQPLERGGGRRRGWIALPPDTVPQALQHQDWIIIPQHPNGFPQRIDLGRFRECDQTGTRIRYSTNTAKGTSGAPCFNQKFALVGVHNAYVGPEDQPLANQAIRFDHIAALVRQHTKPADAADLHALRWSISREGEEPRVILGRKTLLEWLKASASPDLRTLADRVYAAQAKLPGAGCSFSGDVLHAEIRDSKIPRALYGERGQQLPATAEDFLLSFLRELGIDLKDDKIPERPGTPGDLGMPPPIVGEVDKLDRWLSDELPEWLGGVITQHVEQKIDARVAARQAVQVFEQQHLPAPEELRAQAMAAEPVWVRPIAWDFAYIVIDGLRVNSYEGPGARTDLKGEVRSLIAALVRGKPEQAMHPGLKRLRWMFLGYLPDFIPAAEAEGNGATLEPLDPTGVGLDDVLAVFERMAQAHLRMQEAEPFMVRVLAKRIVKSVEQPGPEPRLVRLQREASESSVDMLKEIGN